MKELLETTEARMLEGNILPQEASALRVRLSGAISYYLGQLSTIEEQKPVIWNEMRKSFKSDKATERAWQGTEIGLKETRLRNTVKRMDKMQSSLNSLLRLHELEVRNQT